MYKNGSSIGSPDVQVSTNGNSWFNGGNVGIGITSPAAKLDVSQDNAGFGLIVGADLTASTRTNLTRKASRISMPHYTNSEEPIGIFVGDSDSAYSHLKFGGGSSVTNAATELQFFTAANTTTTTGTQRMTINSSGDIGIGTTTPSAKLHIVGSGTTGELLVNTTSNSSSISIASLLAPNATGDTYFSIGRALTTASSALIGLSSIGSANNYAFLTTYGRPASDFVVSSTGNIGMGATNPTSSFSRTLQITGAGSSAITLDNGGTKKYSFGLTGTNSLGFYDETASAYRMSISTGGNVGIGQTTPTAVLHLKAGTATASTAPLKFATGTVLTTPEAGTMEFTNSETGLTFTAVSTRRQVVLDTATQTLTNKRINPRVVTATSYTTNTGTSLDISTCDQFEITAQAGALLFNAPSGTPVAGNKLIIRIKDNGTARALTYNAIFRGIGNTLPSTTVISKTLYMGFIYNATDTKWDLVAVAQEA